MNRKGFTLIELLIVIVIIGLLAAVVIAAIDPIESRNRAVDTGKNSDASELFNANERYFASRGQYPWTTISATAPAGNAYTTAMLDELIAAKEVKPEFKGRVTSYGSNMLSYFDATNNQLKVCFVPASKNFQSGAKWVSSGGAFPTLGTVGATGNMVCVPN